MSEYVICGSYYNHAKCLVCVIGNSYAKAEQTLIRMKTCPTENDKKLTGGCLDLWIEEVPAEECWWND